MISKADYKRLSKLAEDTLHDRVQGKGRARIALGVLRARDELAGVHK